MDAPIPAPPDEFTGTRRYTPTRVLGAGSWGRVYQAYDNERNAFVAVKLLSKFNPDALLRFKREFRALQNVTHPNLVTLYELLSDADRWFFTMEHVDGKTFLDYVLGDGSDIEPIGSSSGEGTTGATIVFVSSARRCTSAVMTWPPSRKKRLLASRSRALGATA